MLRLFSLESAGGRRETGQRRQLCDVHRKQVESSCLRLLYQVIFTMLSVGLGRQAWSGGENVPPVVAHWQKMRINQGQELVIVGYKASAKNFDALVIGYYATGLIDAAHTEWIHPGLTCRTVQEDQTSGNREYFFTNPPEKKGRPLRRGHYCIED